MWSLSGCGHQWRGEGHQSGFDREHDAGPAEHLTHEPATAWTPTEGQKMLCRSACAGSPLSPEGGEGDLHPVLPKCNMAGWPRLAAARWASRPAGRPGSSSPRPRRSGRPERMNVMGKSAKGSVGPATSDCGPVTSGYGPLVDPEHALPPDRDTTPPMSRPAHGVDEAERRLRRYLETSTAGASRSGTEVVGHLCRQGHSEAAARWALHSMLARGELALEPALRTGEAAAWRFATAAGTTTKTSRSGRPIACSSPGCSLPRLRRTAGRRSTSASSPSIKRRRWSTE